MRGHSSRQVDGNVVLKVRVEISKVIFKDEFYNFIGSQWSFQKAGVILSQRQIQAYNGFLFSLIKLITRYNFVFRSRLK